MKRQSLWTNSNETKGNQFQGALFSVLPNCRVFGDVCGATDEEWEQMVPMLPMRREIDPQGMILPVCARIPAGLRACFGESTCSIKETFPTGRGS